MNPKKRRYAEKLINHSRSAKRRKGLSKLSRLPGPHFRELNELRILADRISVITGVRHTVDHIYPLKHTHFCGLTVPWNMQILPHDVDNMKSNTRPEDIPWMNFKGRIKGKYRPKVPNRQKVKGWKLGQIITDADRERLARNTEKATNGK